MVAIGVMLTVFFHAYITGVMGESIDFNAKFSTGHVKIMSRAYAENESQLPNDLALTGSHELVTESRNTPEMKWVSRIRFGGLIDVPDSSGETREQGPAMGLGIDLLSDSTMEPRRLKLNTSLVRGSLPSRPGRSTVERRFLQKLNVNPGDTDHAHLVYDVWQHVNIQFHRSGTIYFGTSYLDRGAVIADLSDVRKALNMEDASGEILGFFQNGYYNNDKAEALKTQFNARFSDPDDIFSPVMVTLGTRTAWMYF